MGGSCKFQTEQADKLTAVHKRRSSRTLKFLRVDRLYFRSVNSRSLGGGLRYFTQHLGQAVKELGGYERLGQLPEVEFQNTTDHVHLRAPQPGDGFT